MVWPVHNSPFSLRSPGCLEGCKMVDRGQSKKTERPCVEYLINRFESETENFCGGSNSAADSLADADSSWLFYQSLSRKKLLTFVLRLAQQSKYLTHPPYITIFQALFNFKHQKLESIFLSGKTLYSLPQCVVWLTQADLLRVSRKHDNPALKSSIFHKNELCPH